jgi:methylthioribose-1-phosphate isomerase
MDAFARSRPTAVNLFYAIEHQKRAVSAANTVDSMKLTLVAEAVRIHNEEEKAMSALSRKGAALLRDGSTVLTHCNTGQLATGVSYGTALGVIKAAAEQGKRLTVYADETRPLLQGARLTAWELQQLKIPFRLITDSMAGYFMRRGQVDCVIVGADRIAANGDTANKIGTYSLAVLAKENGIPFYVAAPLSTIDLSIKSGDEIPIEERSPQEVLEFRGVRSAPRNSSALNPAFDVTPAKYIHAMITQNGIINKPFIRGIKSIFQEES